MGNEDALLKRFREHAQFVCLVIIAFTCLNYLMSEFRAILLPLVWAGVLAMTLFPITIRVELALMSILQKCCSMERKSPEWKRIYKEMRTIGKETAQADPKSTNWESSDDERSQHSSAPARRGTRRRDKNVSPLSRTSVFRREGSCMPRFCGVFVSIAVIFVCVAGFTFMVIDSIWHLKENINFYEIGARRIANTTETILTRVFVKLPKKVVDDITISVMNSGEAWVSSAIGGMIHHIGEILIEGMMMCLYLTFLLCAPMPTSERTHALFQRYIYFKSASCFGYGLSVGFLLHFLKVDLAAVFGLTNFIFNFVPEVGAIIAMLLPCPVILLDSRIDNPFFTLAVAMLGQMGLKFLFGNIVEVKMVESDRLMRMHPVVILVAVAFFGYLWGPTGMLVSVPVMGYVKVSLLNDSVPAVYRDAILVFLEGDVHAPLRHSIRGGESYLQDSDDSDQLPPIGNKSPVPKIIGSAERE